MRSLWLIRHGETDWALTGAHTGNTDIPLTEFGRLQARMLLPVLQHVEFAAVYTSPLQRARETCALAGFEDQALVLDGLREWDYGIFEGKTRDEILIHHPGWNLWDSEIIEGESLHDVGKRADDIIAKILSGPMPAKDTAVALFAHGHILRILAARWIGLAARDGALFPLGTASISVLGYERDTRVIRHWNRGLEV